MGLFTDAVEAEAHGHHFSVRGAATLFGGRFSLFVDGKKRDWVHGTYFFAPRKTLMAVVDDELVCVEVSLLMTGTQYRLFVGDEEISLHVETGESSLWVQLPRPRLLSARSTRALLR